jgi:hypothetical protein
MDSNTIYHISTLMGSMYYNNPPFSLVFESDPSPYGVPLITPCIGFHSMYIIATSMGSTYVSHPSLTYGVDSGSNIKTLIPSITKTILLDVPSVGSHIFQSNKDILESMTSSNYPWDDMHHRSYFLSQDSFTPFPTWTPLRKEIWSTFFQPSRWIFLLHPILQNIYFLEFIISLKKCYLTNHSSKSSMTFSLGRIHKWLVLMLTL